MAKIFLTSIFFLFSVLGFQEKEKPKILIIGDSISIGYTPYVEEKFGDQAIVKHNPGNAQHTGTGLEKIEEWLGDEDWDIIQINWGLWDLCYRHPSSKEYGDRDKINGAITFSLDEYKANLDSLVTLIQSKSEAKMIFVTTTYVPENEAGRFKSDVQKYNQAAKEVMNEHGVIINNLYESSVSIHKKYGKGKTDVHFKPRGYKQLGEIIFQFLLKELEVL